MADDCEKVSMRVTPAPISFDTLDPTEFCQDLLGELDEQRDAIRDVSEASPC
jgi:hypothetical protein